MGEKTPEAPINASPNDQARVARWGGVQEGDPSDWAVPRECRVRVPDLGGVEPPQDRATEQRVADWIAASYRAVFQERIIYFLFFFIYISSLAQ